MAKAESSYIKDLNWIEKHYGLKTKLLCKRLFPRILDYPGVLPAILEAHFPKNKSLGGDIELQGKKKETEFKNYIFSFFNTQKDFEKSIKSPAELLDEAGYILMPECLTNAEMLQYEYYYARGEELCSFWNNRVDDCRVWFAIKKNVDQIKRLPKPDREDAYAVSVISIQFTRDEFPTLSIKNRYNHTVTNPDNTFESNLDNIIPGLTDAFHREFGVIDTINYKSGLQLENYVYCDGKHYKYTNRLNNVYFCPNNTIIDNFKPIVLPNNQMLIDYFIFDFKAKTITPYIKGTKDAFADSMKDIKDIAPPLNNTITISFEGKEDVVITITRNREIEAVYDPNLVNCGDNYLLISRKVEYVDLPNLQSCGARFLHSAQHLDYCNLPKLTRLGRESFTICENDTEVLEKIKNNQQKNTLL